METDGAISEELQALSRRVRRSFWRSEITEAEALQQLKPYLDAWKARAAAVAKALGARPRTISAKQYLRYRRDLRWENEEQAREQRLSDQDAQP